MTIPTITEEREKELTSLALRARLGVAGMYPLPLITIDTPHAVPTTPPGWVIPLIPKGHGFMTGPEIQAKGPSQGW